MLSVAVEDSFAKKIDAFVASSGLYSSRSEFLKDSIRKNIAQTVELTEDFKKFRESTEKLAAIAKQRGYKGGLLSIKEKYKIAREFLKEKGFM